MIRKILAALVFLTLFTCVMGGSHYYVAQRVAIEPEWPAWLFRSLIALMALGLAGVAFEGFLRRRLRLVASRFSWAAYCWLGLFFYLFLATATLDGILALLHFMAPAELLADDLAVARGRAAVIVTLSTVLSSIGLYNGLQPPQIRRVEVVLPRLPKSLSGFRIVQISDVHIGPLLDRRFAEHICTRINALAPDLVAITGDLVDGRVSRIGSEIEPLRALRAHHGIFSVTGNHDYFSGADDWVAHTEELGWQTLRNRHVTIERDGVAFQLAGVDDRNGAMIEKGGGEDLPAALAERNPDLALVLLAHDPATFRRASKLGIDLQISGHTHGGQIWPFNWAVRAAVPWVRGHHRVGESQLYVSSGTGFWGPPMRLGTTAEITELILRSS